MAEEYEWDVRCADLELRRLQAGFTTDDLLHFAGVVARAHQSVVNDIHVETGSLRESAKFEIMRAGAREFDAEISVGGESGGVKNPVRYAASEFFGTSARHGGPPSHSFFKRVGWSPGEFGDFSQGVPIEDDLIGPVTSYFSRGRNTPHPERGGL
jgi:hypothetical protein